MTTDLKEKPLGVNYAVADETIDKIREQLTGLTADTPQGYEDVRKGIAVCRDYRVKIEKRRVELKADALDYGRRVDAEAKRLTALLTAIEEPLKLTKQAVDDEKDRIRREKEEAAKAKIEAEQKALREAEERAEFAKREAERQANEAERLRLDAERKALAEQVAKQEAAQRAEQERLEAERRKLAEERRDVELQQAAERARQEERERAEQERIASIERARQAEARRPDVEKIGQFAAQLTALELPAVTDEKCVEVRNIAWRDISGLVARLEEFVMTQQSK